MRATRTKYSLGCHLNATQVATMGKLRMKRHKSLLVALMALVAVSGAGAQTMMNKSGYYGELGYLALKYKEDGGDGASGYSANPKLVRIFVGKEIDATWSVEGMAAFTASKGSLNDSVGGHAEPSASGYGVFVKPKLEIAKDTEVFGRLGYAHTSLKLSAPGVSASTSKNKPAYGIGLQTKFTKDIYGQIDYMNYSHGDGWTSDGLTFSVGSRF